MSGIESNPPLSQESKSAKKKKAKAEAAGKITTVQPSLDPEAAKSPVENVTNGVDGPYESPYVKELNKCASIIMSPHPCFDKANSMVGIFATSRRSWYADSIAVDMPALSSNDSRPQPRRSIRLLPKIPTRPSMSSSQPVRSTRIKRSKHKRSHHCRLQSHNSKNKSLSTNNSTRITRSALLLRSLPLKFPTKPSWTE